jgi:hypothetical protein
MLLMTKEEIERYGVTAKVNNVDYKSRYIVSGFVSLNFQKS